MTSSASPCSSSVEVSVELPQSTRSGPSCDLRSFDLLLGRRTYDSWSGFWQKAPSGPMADGFKAAKKYVATHRPESLEWGPFEALGPDIVAGTRRITIPFLSVCNLMESSVTAASR
jgi:hypothetical protein